jgi:hypothetical protein
MLKRRPMVGQLPKKTSPKPTQRSSARSAPADDVIDASTDASTGTSAGASTSTAQVARPQIKIPQILAELEEACKHVGIRLTYEAIGGELGSGGLCKVKGKWRAIFDKRTTPAERVTLLVPILSRFPVDMMPLSEPVRELVLRMQRPSERAVQEMHAAP